MESKEYYQSFISVINYVADGHRVITLEKGEELAGNYWPRIYLALKENKIGVGMSGGQFDITQAQYLNPIYEDCIHALEEIEKREADRSLDRASKYAGIKYARFAFWISVSALLVSLASLVWQIIG
jgi:hypothetical protein